jgi:hypothetical protein
MKEPETAESFAQRINKARWSAVHLWMREAKEEEMQILPPSLDVLLTWLVEKINSLEASLSEYEKNDGR